MYVAVVNLRSAEILDEFSIANQSILLHSQLLINRVLHAASFYFYMKKSISHDHNSLLLFCPCYSLSARFLVINSTESLMVFENYDFSACFSYILNFLRYSNNVGQVNILSDSTYKYV